MRKRWLVLVAGLLLTSGCTSSSDASFPPSAASFGNPLQDKHTVFADRAGRSSAELAVLTGATAVVVRSADLDGKLFRAWTPDGSRLLPHADVDGDVVRLSLADGTGHGPADVHVELASDVAWQVRLAGGAAEQTLDLRTAKVQSVDFDAGAQRVDLTLPAPNGSVPVRMTGGASVFDLHLPQGTEAQVRFAGGAGRAVIDGVPTTGLAGGTVLETTNLDRTADHYVVDAVAGVASLTIDRT